MYLEIIFLIFVTYFTYQLLIKFAEKFNLVDRPNSRSSHTYPIVRGFGIVMFVSIGLTLIVFNLSLFIQNLNLLSAVLLVGILGLVDDSMDVSPVTKILTLIVVCAFLFVEGFLITNLGVFLGINLELNLLISIIFSTVVIVIFTNAFNLIDGLDGLSGLVSIIIFVSFFVIGVSNNDKSLVIIPALFVASLCVFLFYNWHPAKVFLGDSGSLMIGFVISILGIKSLGYIEPISILYIASVPIIDSLFVILQRILSRSPIFRADKNHCHHILLSYFDGRVNKTVVCIALFQLITSTIGLMFISKVNDSFVSLMLFLLLFFIVFKILNKLKNQRGDNN